ncbi:MAG: glycosyl hydrolase family 18 [Lachnospiraceae bacterium]|nr:glycosyl hydrolase family 18 [Lachnospiraceae bacterium]
MDDYRERARRRARLRRRNQILIMTLMGLLVIGTVAVILLVNKYMPSKERMDLETLYTVDEGKAPLFFENERAEKDCLVIDGVPYVEFETVRTLLNKRFYWDTTENVLLYTTPTDLIRAEVGSDSYTVNKAKESLGHPVVKTQGSETFVALDFVQKYTNIDYKVYENPDRVLLSNAWGVNYTYSKVHKATQLRSGDSIKSSIVCDLEAGAVLRYFASEDAKSEDDFILMMTEDGLTGYVRRKFLDPAYEESKTRDFTEPTYSSLSKDYTINLAWHQVTNQTANDNLLNVLSNTKGLTTISPTWFTVNSNEGGLGSIASQTYVERAHAQGLEVWALVDDFTEGVDMFKVLSRTTYREQLENELISAALKYNLDGINIDFEKISLETGVHYVQFLRELSIKCRNNGVILSVDNYVPTAYSQYFDYEEQGKVCDYVVIMAYDEHNRSSETAGSVSSLPYVKDAVANTLAMVPAEKIIMGIPFYTRLWITSEDDNGIETLNSEVYGMNSAANMLKDNNVTAAWDETTGQNYAQFENSKGFCQIWLEDEESIEAKLKVIFENKLAGVAEWRLVYERADVWNVIQKYVN